LQLRAFSKDSLLKVNLSHNVTVENMQQIGRTETLSDTLKVLKLRFDLVSEQQRIKDSVYAIIISKDIEVEGKPGRSNKILFSRTD